MKQTPNTSTHFAICKSCQGRGQKRKRARKKDRVNYKEKLEQLQKDNTLENIPSPPKGHLYSCPDCSGSGLVTTNFSTKIDKDNLPHVAIIGGGIGGVALAVACLHRGIPFTLFERDNSFDSRSQGYGLTLQQASKAMKGFGINTLEEGIISTRHIVHTTKGKVIGEWGMRKWLSKDNKKRAKHSNIHIARQALRLAMIKQLGGQNTIQWNHQLTNFKYNKNNSVNLQFNVNGTTKEVLADLVVGADGIRSTVRKQLLGKNTTPLRYLDCIVILGICSLNKLKETETALLDGKTVFQTANGNERIYMMPFSKEAIMWQLSFPLPEEQAKKLSAKGAKALKEEACRRTQWHTPIPQILKATNQLDLSGYPVYDRDLLTPENLKTAKQITLIGDAAHPMSPFKGQGANQALLDALALARQITLNCGPNSNWKTKGIRQSVLNTFESEMLERSASKVKGSAEAVLHLHSETVLKEANKPRGRSLS